jgi:CBS domain-containing protein
MALNMTKVRCALFLGTNLALFIPECTLAKEMIMTKAQDIMTVDVGCATPETSLTEIARLMVEFDCGEVPLVDSYETKKVIGVVTDRDIVCRTLGVGKNPLNCSAMDCMSSPTVTVEEDQSIEEVIDLMQEHQIRRIPVIDGQGILCGMISFSDLAQEISEETAGDMLQHISRSSDSASQMH